MPYDPNNIFAKIIRGELPAEKLFEDDSMLIIKDLYPRAAVHLLAIPKGDYISFHDFSSKATPELVHHFFERVHHMVETLGLEEQGYRILSNHGEGAGQVVPHFHLHILSGKELQKSF